MIQWSGDQTMFIDSRFLFYNLNPEASQWHKVECMNEWIENELIEYAF